MAYQVEIVHVDTKPNDSESENEDHGRSNYPDRGPPKEHNPKYKVDDHVWFVEDSDEERKAYVMVVYEVKKIEKHCPGAKYPFISFVYRIKDSSGIEYEKGVWIEEKRLESS